MPLLQVTWLKSLLTRKKEKYGFRKIVHHYYLSNCSYSHTFCHTDRRDSRTQTYTDTQNTRVSRLHYSPGHEYQVDTLKQTHTIYQQYKPVLCEFNYEIGEVLQVISLPTHFPFASSQKLTQHLINKIIILIPYCIYIVFNDDLHYYLPIFALRIAIRG